MSIEKITPIASLKPIESIAASGGAASAGLSSVPFANMLGQAMQDVGQAQEAATNDAYDLVMGTGDDLHTIMIRSAMETAAIETAVELTTRVVSAYKEIMQMQV